MTIRAGVDGCESSHVDVTSKGSLDMFHRQVSTCETASRSVKECVDSLCDLGVGLHQTNVYLVQPRVKRRRRDWSNGLSGSSL